ncbi:DUF6923 family protein [Spirosoma areae]
MNPQVPTPTQRPGSRYGLRWLLWLLLLGGFTQQAQAQFVYAPVSGQGSGTTSPNVYRYDIATNAWTILPAAPADLEGALTSDGTFLYADAESGTTFYRYNPATSTWTTLAPTPGNIGGDLAYDGSGRIYAAVKSQGNTGEPASPTVYRYDIATNTWTTLPAAPADLEGGIAFGGGFLYADGDVGATFYRYNPATNTWTTLAPTPANIVGDLVYDGSGRIYAPINGQGGGTISPTVYRYDVATNTWTTLPDAPADLEGGVAFGGGFLYADADVGTAFYRYSPTTSTWTTLAPSPVDIAGNLVFAAGCATPGFVASVSPATCSGSTANSNGTIQISSVSNGARVGFSAGSTYTGPAFASATSFTGTTATVTTTLANPAVAQPYTIRVFCDAGTFFDQVVTLQPTQCLTANLSLAVAPPTQTKNPGDVATYVYTLTNAGPSTAPNVQVKVYVPANVTLVSNVPQSGTYNEGTNIWTIPSVAVGSQTLSLSVRIN